MALAPAGALACASLAAGHAPVPVACEFIASLSQQSARAEAPPRAQQRVAARSVVRSLIPETAAPWRAPGSPAPSQAPPA